MSAGSTRPGPPPPPPSDLPARPLPLHALPVGTTLFRIHWRHFDPIHFGRSVDASRRSRWDAPDASYGVCYLGETDAVAFAETFLRQTPARFVETGQLAERSLATFRTLRPLRLARLHGDGLARLGATLAVVAGPYDLCQAWSGALHAHPAQPVLDGVSYRARHDDGFAAAIFDRAADAVAEVGRTPLLDPDHAATLAAWLDRYGLGLL